MDGWQSPHDVSVRARVTTRCTRYGGSPHPCVLWFGFGACPARIINDLYVIVGARNPDYEPDVATNELIAVRRSITRPTGHL